MFIVEKFKIKVVFFLMCLLIFLWILLVSYEIGGGGGLNMLFGVLKFGVVLKFLGLNWGLLLYLIVGVRFFVVGFLFIVWVLVVGLFLMGGVILFIDVGFMLFIVFIFWIGELLWIEWKL